MSVNLVAQSTSGLAFSIINLSISACNSYVDYKKVVETTIQLENRYKFLLEDIKQKTLELKLLEEKYLAKLEIKKELINAIKTDYFVKEEKFKLKKEFFVSKENKLNSISKKISELKKINPNSEELKTLECIYRKMLIDNVNIY
ncbi:MAG: hypothetical protein U0457_12770 [Candidatus Sericytochromatia bacterium]